MTLFVTDKRTSICIKAFVVNEKWDDIDHYLGAGDGVKIKGQAQWDRFDNCTVIMADSIEKAEKKNGWTPIRRNVSNFTLIPR